MSTPALKVAPKDCHECAKSCPYKQEGCTFDLAVQLDTMRRTIEGVGAKVTGLDATFVRMQADAKQCRLAITARIQEENAAIEEENQMVQLLEKALTRPEVLVRVRGLVDAAPHRPAPHQGGQPQVHPVATRVAENSNLGRGNVDLFVRVEDAELDARMLAEKAVNPDLHNICVTPKMSVAKFTEDYVEGLRAEFAQEPFMGLIAVIPKYHAEDRNLCRVGVWYHGPPQREAAAIRESRSDPEARARKAAAKARKAARDAAATQPEVEAQEEVPETAEAEA